MKTTTRPLAPRRMARRMVPRKVLHARAAASEEDFDEIEGESEPNMKLSHAFIVVLVLHVLAVGGVFAFNTLKTKQLIPDRAAKAASVKTEAAQASQQAAEAAAPAEKPAPAEQPTYTVVAGDTLKKIASRHKTSIEAIEKANDITSTTTIRVGQVLRLPASASVKAVATQAKPAPPAAPAAKVASAGVVAPLPVAKTQAISHTPSKPAASKDAGAAGPSAKSAELKAPKASDAKSAEPKAAPAAEPKTAASAATSEDSAKSYVVASGDNPYTIAKKLKISYSDLLKANKIDDPKKLQIGQKLIIP